MKTVKNWIIIFSISVFLLLIRDILIPYDWPNYLSYKGALYLLPCFILGVGLNRFKTAFQNQLIKYSIPVILLACFIIQQLSWFKIIDYPVNKDNWVGLLIGLTGTMMLLRIRMKINWLVWFGGFAYSIYLFHAFGTAGGRILIQKLNMHSAPVIFTVSLIAGLLLPVAAEKIFKRFKITRILFLGKS
jgi:peptidoglycan/LPS O-acetylase OafA/YrhL